MNAVSREGRLEVLCSDEWRYEAPSNHADGRSLETSHLVTSPQLATSMDTSKQE